LIALRFTQPDTRRPFKLRPTIGRVPVLPVLALGGVGFMLANLDAGAVAIGFGLVVAGVVATTLYQAAGAGGQTDADI
jgi:hypothetical protein